MNSKKRLVSNGFALVRRHQRILWWVFGINLLLAILGAMPASIMTGKLLNNSLASQLIAGRFHIASYFELVMQPEVQLAPAMTASFAMQLVFFFLMLFLTGGILVVYREDRKLSKAEFFENCGLYFWRFFRLMLISLIPFAVTGFLYQGVRKVGDKIAEASPLESNEFWWRMIAGFVVLLVILFVRLWFDVAQVRAVAQNERGMWRNTLRALKISWNALGTLLWMYFRISLVAWIVAAAALWLWLRIRGNVFGLSFLLWELVILVWFAVRLWQRASAISWYKQYADEHPVVAADYTTPKPSVVVDQPAPAGN